MVHSLAQNSIEPDRAAFALVTGAGLALACLWWARPRELEVLFELQDRKVMSVEHHGYRALARSESHYFTDIASLGAQERRTRLVDDYLPVIKLKNGRGFSISVAHGSAREVGRLVDILCAALELPRVDSPTRTSW
jgi:hypothetical protein